MDHADPGGRDVSLAVSPRRARDVDVDGSVARPRRPRRVRADLLGSSRAWSPTTPASLTTGSAWTRAVSARAVPRSRATRASSRARGRRTSREPARGRRTWPACGSTRRTALLTTTPRCLRNMQTTDVARDADQIRAAKDPTGGVVGGGGGEFNAFVLYAGHDDSTWLELGTRSPVTSTRATSRPWSTSTTRSSGPAWTTASRATWRGSAPTRTGRAPTTPSGPARPAPRAPRRS